MWSVSTLPPRASFGGGQIGWADTPATKFARPDDHVEEVSSSGCSEEKAGSPEAGGDFRRAPGRECRRRERENHTEYNEVAGSALSTMNEFRCASERRLMVSNASPARHHRDLHEGTQHQNNGLSSRRSALNAMYTAFCPTPARAPSRCSGASRYLKPTA